MTSALITGSLGITVALVDSLVVRFEASTDLTTLRTSLSLGIGPRVTNTRRILITTLLILKKKRKEKKDDK